MRNFDRARTKEAVNWYQGLLKSDTNKKQDSTISVQSFMGANRIYQSSRIVPGKMIAYYYDPKYKDTLPWYDSFPLVLPFGVDDEGFIGLNMHYLPYQMREDLLKRLMAFSTDDKVTERTKIEVSWKFLKTASDLPGVKYCVKRYLFEHVKSKFIMIPPKDWEHVIHLPLARFKKANESTVWKGVR